jgi:uncharacterized membrane protein YdjX (TVP38/TMEM64 family)
MALLLNPVLFIPGSILTVGTGFAFGAAMGSPTKGVLLASTVSFFSVVNESVSGFSHDILPTYRRLGLLPQAVFFGAFAGSVCSFLLGRYLFRDFVLRLASHYPIFQAVDRALEANGLKIMILLRLSPLIPYNVSYQSADSSAL